MQFLAGCNRDGGRLCTTPQSNELCPAGGGTASGCSAPSCTSQACLRSRESSTMSNKQLLPAGVSVWAAAVNVAGPTAQPLLCELDTWHGVWRGAEPGPAAAMAAAPGRQHVAGRHLELLRQAANWLHA